MAVRSIGTYLPPWAKGPGRAPGPDEDAVTMAVEAGRAALAAAGDPPVEQVVLVTRDLPLLEGGNGAALLAGLGVGREVDAVERIGGAPAALDALAAAPDATLVVAADTDGPAGAAAAVTGPNGGALIPVARVHRSLPLRVRTGTGAVHQDDDPRLQRERGVRASLDAAGLPGKPAVLAGLPAKAARPFCEGDPPELATVGASSGLLALAAVADRRAPALVAAVEQATVSAASFDPAGVTVARVEAPPRQPPSRRAAPGPDIKIAFTAYDRAFEPKLRWEAGRCPHCGTLALPPRHRCLECGAEGDAELVALPRTGEVYTTTTIHVPVPGLATPYSLAVVELDDVGVRALMTVTDSDPGDVGIGDRGQLVLRRVATRTGVPDYGYAFQPA